MCQTAWISVIYFRSPQNENLEFWQIYKTIKIRVWDLPKLLNRGKLLQILPDLPSIIGQLKAYGMERKPNFCNQCTVPAQDSTSLTIEV